MTYRKKTKIRVSLKLCEIFDAKKYTHRQRSNERHAPREKERIFREQQPVKEYESNVELISVLWLTPHVGHIIARCEIFIYYVC